LCKDIYISEIISPHRPHLIPSSAGILTTLFRFAIMEVTGLVIGVAGLTSLFGTCVRLLDVIGSGKRHGRDYQVLLCMLEAERVRLLLWGEKVGIPSHAASDEREKFTQSAVIPHVIVNPCLGHPEISSSIVNILSCLKLVFEDAEKLEQRYGLIKRDHLVSPMEHNLISPIFKHAYVKLQFQMSETQRSAKFTSKARWAVSDKTKFRSFIGDIKVFNDSLYSLISDISSTDPTKIEAEIRLSDNLQSLEIPSRVSKADPNRMSENTTTRPVDLSSDAPTSRSADELQNADDLALRLENVLSKRSNGSVRVTTWRTNAPSFSASSSCRGLQHQERYSVPSKISHVGLGTISAHHSPH
jgi:Prion-inhibition and propagation